MYLAIQEDSVERTTPNKSKLIPPSKRILLEALFICFCLWLSARSPSRWHSETPSNKSTGRPSQRWLRNSQVRGVRAESLKRQSSLAFTLKRAGRLHCC